MAKKKRKAEAESDSGPNAPDARQNDVELVNGNPHKKIKKKKKRTDEETQEIPTVSIAVPGSIIDNTQSFELATRVHLSLLSIYFSVYLNSIFALLSPRLNGVFLSCYLSFFSILYYFLLLSWLVRLHVRLPFSESMKFVTSPC